MQPTRDDRLARQALAEGRGYCEFEPGPRGLNKCRHCGRLVDRQLWAICSTRVPGARRALHVLPHAPEEGPGTELRKILKRYGLKPCQQCHATAAKMNTLGPDLCEEQIEELADEIETNIGGSQQAAVKLFRLVTTKAGRRRKILKKLRLAIRRARTKN